MAEYRLKAEQTGPRSYKKELQMISYRGDAIFSDEGNVLLSESDVYYPRDYLASTATPVVLDSKTFKEDSVSLGNKFSKGRPAALPIIEQFKEETEVSRTLLGINRTETQQGLFEDVSSYGLDKKDWIIYSGYPDWLQGDNWKYKNSPSGPHNPAIDYDDEKGSSIVLTSYPVPFTNPGNPVVENRINGISSEPGPGWGRYLQSVIAMYILEYMVNNFSIEDKIKFQIQYLEGKYPKKDNKFNRLFWDQIWLDIDQGRFEQSKNIPIIPQGRIVNMFIDPKTSNHTLNLDLFGTTILEPSEKNPSINYSDLFFATTRYTWQEPNEGHYRIKTNLDPEIWSRYWGINFNTLPQDLKDWEFRVLEQDPGPNSPEVKYKLPYFKINSKTPSNSLLFGSSWPKSYSDSSIPQIEDAIAEGNIIGDRESNYAVVTMTSNRAFRYQPGRISGFTYGVRISEEGAGPGTVMEFGVENFTDGYFFRLKDGTDFSVVRRSTIPLGNTQLFTAAGYKEKEVYIDQITGVAKYKEDLTDSEILDLEDEVEAKRQVKVFETSIQQNQMNGDGLNSQGRSGYVYNPDTVTMYKIEFGWYGAIGARFYVYIPQGNGDARWVAVHTLVIENNIEYPCLKDPFFFFKYRVYVDSPSRIRLPQFIEKYGASYYIDGGDEGTITVSNSNSTNRTIESIQQSGFGAQLTVNTNSSGQISLINPTPVSGGINYSVGDILSIDEPGSPTLAVNITIASVSPTGSILTFTTPSLPAGANYTSNQTGLIAETSVVDSIVKTVESPIYKWGTVMGIKPKQYITNTEGNEFFNKKEIFPISASIISTKDIELKFVSQFGCQENGFTFQEGYKCELPESQRLRGLFQINRWQKDEETLIDLGRNKDAYTPTISYIGSDDDYPESAGNLEDNGDFIGWDAYNYSLYGSHIIGNDVYCSYVNPEKEGLLTTSGFSNNEIAIARSTRQYYSSGLISNKAWSHSSLLFRYPDASYSLKLSRYRRDTTLISSVPISTDEFYLLFTTKGNGMDRASTSCQDPDFNSKCDGLKHFGDLTIGVIWPIASASSNTLNDDEVYPTRIYSTARANQRPDKFGIIDPNTDVGATAGIEESDNEDVYVVSDIDGNYVVDRTIPNATSYRYYEGLPLNVFDRSIDGNTIKTNYTGWLVTDENGLEISEGSTDGGAEIDNQFPDIPGADGGECNALFARVGDVNEESTVSSKDRNGVAQIDGPTGKQIYYLSKKTPWPSDLYQKSTGVEANEILLIERVSNGAIIQVNTNGDPQQEYIPSGSDIRQYFLPVIVSGNNDFSSFVDQEVLVNYRAISIYAPSLIKKDDRLIERKIVGQNIFPLRWFISMREGAEIGSISVGQVTPNGIIQSPFSPHGSTLSVKHYSNNGDYDRHDGGSGGGTNSAIKTIKAFSEEFALDVANGEDFSYYNVTQGTDVPEYDIKKCTSFISNDSLSGTGVSSVGDYPIRWLKFKDSGDPIGSFYISKNTPTEIDLKSLFNISAESVGPSFWGNKSLFAIVKSLEDGGGDGKVSITLNYKEQ